MTTNETQTSLTVGMGATLCGWSDSTPLTVIAFAASGKKIVCQEDKATLLNGPQSGEPDALQVYPGGFCAHVEGTQRYAYERNPEGRTYTATLRKNGKWVLVGESAKGGTRIHVGQRRKHYDYNF